MLGVCGACVCGFVSGICCWFGFGVWLGVLVVVSFLFGLLVLLIVLVSSYNSSLCVYFLFILVCVVWWVMVGDLLGCEFGSFCSLI